MTISQVVAFGLNNIMALAAGGLVTAWLAWRLWQKIERTVGSINGWGSLCFWVSKIGVIIFVLVAAGGFIFRTIDNAVRSAVTSPSTQVAGQALVGAAAGIDYVLAGGGSAGSGGVGLQNAMFEPVSFTGSDTAPAGDAAPAAGLQSAFGGAQVAGPTATPAPIVVAAAYPSSSASQERMHVVMPGDTVSKIALFYYHDSGLAGAICAANGIANCSGIFVGQRLRLPAIGQEGWTQLASTNAPAMNAPAVQDGLFAADGRVYYETKAIDFVPAAIAVGCQGCVQPSSYVEAAPAAQQMAPITAIPPVVYEVAKPVFEISVSGGNGGQAAPAPTAAPRPTAVPQMAIAVELASPRIDTSVGGIGASSSASGTTMATGN